MKFNTGFFLIICFVLFASCKQDPKSTVVAKKPNVRIPVFQQDSAYAHIEKQLSFGPRNPGSEGHSCLLYTSPSPRDKRQSRMPSSA